jgi:hypothetical protein
MKPLRTRIDQCGQLIQDWRQGWAGLARRKVRDDRGMNTAEYAVGTLAAVAFAGILFKVLTSDAVQDALTSIIQRALR